MRNHHGPGAPQCTEQLTPNTQPVGERPLIELEPTDHPLAVEEREGITLARVRAIAERVLHPEQDEKPEV